jgi:hypothetical protein
MYLAGEMKVVCASENKDRSALTYGFRLESRIIFVPLKAGILVLES